MATSPWRHYVFALKDCRTIFGAGFGVGQWHHLVETFREIEKQNELNYKNTSLYKFLKNFRPKSICDLVTCSDGTKLPLFQYPWGSFNTFDGKKDPLKSRFCGPSEDSFIEEEFHRSIRLFKDLKKSGYRPLSPNNDYVSGSILEKLNGEKIFVVLQGNHRLAALAALGITEVEIRLYPSIVKPFIREKDVLSWNRVKSGDCSVEDSLRIFNWFFDQSGNALKDWVR